MSTIDQIASYAQLHLYNIDTKIVFFHQLF